LMGRLKSYFTQTWIDKDHQLQVSRVIIRAVVED
jgi:hypothetical protein